MNLEKRKSKRIRNKIRRSERKQNIKEEEEEEDSGFEVNDNNYSNYSQEDDQSGYCYRNEDKLFQYYSHEASETEDLSGQNPKYSIDRGNKSHIDKAGFSAYEVPYLPYATVPYQKVSLTSSSPVASLNSAFDAYRPLEEDEAQKKLKQDMAITTTTISTSSLTGISPSALPFDSTQTPLMHSQLSTPPLFTTALSIQHQSNSPLSSAQLATMQSSDISVSAHISGTSAKQESEVFRCSPSPVSSSSFVVEEYKNMLEK
ncbi:uncharacterized protein MONOS_11821 [Monocercomonoides exilis]|uniref:uncharacterized protein n=1 Tax=Monocercomonoides exilis TaxID=2049356 RepID=UPI00355A8BCD|nr:hypothetical protein MONOS_11821 [Monocercomonoides exilis]|eukprot:MONOS_11821.1-p1 / transcript=MONOS_11821.1 / gene=MONOS_11821 / organism=Monocercomonoides_exilis_PA203 / gene_product=unspecified product / transcript_product=unspecified product / location=Mono_scaffold00615:24053-25174(+) / protein_length=259 / sequence_SO=supercontig / SO=protein_coding / is_pseudo=false